MLKKALIFVASTFFLVALTCSAQQVTEIHPSDKSSETARTILRDAVERYKKVGDEVLAEISRQGEFTSQGYYVYVVDTEGTMLASGGPSAIYIGRDITPLLTDELKKTFSQAIATAGEDAVLSSEYRWMNWQDGKVERKRVFYQRIGNKIFASGFYTPRSSSIEAQQLLQDTITAISDNEKTTLTRINSLDPYFNRDDLYVFIINSSNMRFLAHGFNARLVGTNVNNLKGAAGEMIGPLIFEAIKNKQTGQIDYQWRNPVSGKKELKHTFIERVGENIVAVGYYEPLN